MRATSVSLTYLDLKVEKKKTVINHNFSLKLKLHMCAQRDAFIKHLKSKRILLEINILAFFHVEEKNHSLSAAT